MRLSAIQVDVSHDETAQVRVERVLAQVEQLAESSDFITLPELWETGAFDLELGLDRALTLAEQLQTGWLGSLAAIAKSSGTWIHAGSFMELGEGGEDGQLFNTSVLFDDDGEVAATYRKIHLFGFDAGEVALLQPGTELVVVDTPLGRTGLATCYDVRFPELFRQLLDLGAEAIVIPSGWPLGRISTWTTLAQARAIENQAWLIGTNEAGVQTSTPAGEDDRSIKLGGATVVVNPAGKVVALGGETGDVVSLELDPTMTSQIRDRFPILKDRKL